MTTLVIELTRSRVIFSIHDVLIFHGSYSRTHRFDNFASESDDAVMRTDSLNAVVHLVVVRVVEKHLYCSASAWSIVVANRAW
jgi:hypothetical protein